MLSNNRKRGISVVVVCGDQYHDYLRMAMDSIERQTIQPDEVVIVYDNTEPSITSYPYLQTHNDNPLSSRRDGFAATNKEVICFLDADDYISDDYIGTGLALKTDNNIVYSDVRLFGTVNKILHYSPKFMSQENYLHVASLVSRNAINIADAFNPIPPLDCHEDWVFWRRLLKAGCPTIKQLGIHYHREHEHNRSKKIVQHEFPVAKGVKCDTIGFVRVGGQNHEGQVLQQWSQEQTELYAIDSPDIRLINRIINRTNADYLLFYSTKDIIVNKMLANLDYGIVVVHINDLPMWCGTLAVVDILKSQTPFYSFHGRSILI